MEFVVLGVLLFVAAVIAVDTVRQRRIRAARAIDLRGALAGRLAEPGTAILRRPWPRARARAATPVDVYRVIGDTLEVAGLQPRLQDGAEVRIFRLRWGNDYAMIARADRELHYRLEVWEAELLPRMDGTRTVGDRSSRGWTPG